MQVSSIWEEATGKHYDVEFSRVQRFAIVNIVVLTLVIVYTVIQIALLLLSAMEPGLDGIIWGDEVIPIEQIVNSVPFSVVILVLLIPTTLSNYILRITYVEKHKGAQEALAFSRSYSRKFFAAYGVAVAICAALFALNYFLLPEAFSASLPVLFVDVALVLIAVVTHLIASKRECKAIKERAASSDAKIAAA